MARCLAASAIALALALLLRQASALVEDTGGGGRGDASEADGEALDLTDEKPWWRHIPGFGGSNSEDEQDASAHVEEAGSPKGGAAEAAKEDGKTKKPREHKILKSLGMGIKNFVKAEAAVTIGNAYVTAASAQAVVGGARQLRQHVKKVRKERKERGEPVGVVARTVAAVRGPETVTAIIPPSFVACHTEDACAEADLEGTAKKATELLGFAAQAAEAVRARGGEPVLLQIGIGNFANTAALTDVDLYDKLGTKMDLGGVRAIFADPGLNLPGRRDAVWRNVRRTPLNPDKVKLVSGLIMGECRRGTQTMYEFSEQVEADFGVSGAYKGWASAYRKTLEEALPLYVQGLKQSGEVEPETLRRWKHFRDAKNVSRYVTETEHSCYTSASLLQAAGASPDDVVLVSIDAEGEDVQILHDLLARPEFQPGWLQFESRFRNDEAQYEVRELRARGYLVGANSQLDGDADNILAVKERRKE